MQNSLSCGDGKCAPALVSISSSGENQLTTLWNHKRVILLGRKQDSSQYTPLLIIAMWAYSVHGMHLIAFIMFALVLMHSLWHDHFIWHLPLCWFCYLSRQMTGTLFFPHSFYIYCCCAWGSLINTADWPEVVGAQPFHLWGVQTTDQVAKCCQINSC